LICANYSRICAGPLEYCATQFRDASPDGRALAGRVLGGSVAGLLAARVLADGDDSLARRTVDDVVLDELVLHGTPKAVGRELADRLAPLGPDSIGISLLTDDLLGSVGPAAEALHIARARAG